MSRIVLGLILAGAGLALTGVLVGLCLQTVEASGTRLTAATSTPTFTPTPTSTPTPTGLSRLTLGPITQTVRPRGEADLTAQVLSASGAPIPGIVVGFVVLSGPDVILPAGFALTDPTGYAHFAYDALGTGLDNVIAFSANPATLLVSNIVSVIIAQSDPLQTIGLLTFRDSSCACFHACTAAVIASYNQSTIVTAGHCASGNGELFSDFAFAPGFSANAKPFGVWTGVDTFVDFRWLYNGDHSYDFAFITMQPKAGIPIERAVGGGLSISLYSDPNQPWTAYGYPGTPKLRNCGAQTASTTSVDSGDVYNFVMPCNMNGDWRNPDEGASGGPWLTRDDQIGAVSSTSVSCSVIAFFCTKELRGAQFQSAAAQMWFAAINDYSPPAFTPTPTLISQ